MPDVTLTVPAVLAETILLTVHRALEEDRERQAGAMATLPIEVRR